jgi:hypothetical protein
VGKPKGAKQAKAAVRPEAGRGGRTPKTAIHLPATPGTERPVFSFQYADHRYEGEWSWPLDGEASEMLQFLCEMGQLTWNEIRAQQTGGRSRHRKHHEMPFEVLCPEATMRLTDLGHDERFEELFRFRLGNKKRLWGFVSQHIFYVLWWDRDHAVYPTDPD